MTANIRQHIMPRHRVHTRGFMRIAPRSFQRGSVDHTTVTVAAGVVALVIVGALGFFYLRQVVGTASQGTDIHALEADLVEIKERQRELELEGAQLRSLQTVEERVQDLNLVEADHVSYLAPDDSRVALNAQ